MSKTYTLTATSLTRYTGTGRAIITDGASCTKVTASASNYVGYQSAYKAVRAEFGHDVIDHLRTLGSGAITSVTIDIPITGSASATVQTYYGRCSSVTDTHCYVDERKNLDLTGSNGTVFTLDATACGIPVNSYAYAFGGTRSSKTADYYKTVGSGIRLTVITAEKDITLTYNANGGTGAPAKQTLTAVGSAHFTVSAGVPVRTGYTFKGWAAAADATAAAYTAGDGLDTAANKTVYAVWTPLSYAISIRPGTNAAGEERSLTKTYGVTAILPDGESAPYTHLDTGGIAGTGAGFTHDGWSRSAGGETRDYAFGHKYTVNAPLTLYPHFSANNYSLSFDPAGGSACPARTVTFAAACGEPFPVPVRTGYSFLGWFAPDAEVPAAHTDLYLTPGDSTLTARWTPLTFTVTYTDGDTSDTQTVSYGTPWTVAACAFTRAGHTQTGWSTAPDGNGTLYTAGSSVSAWEELTLYAVFTPDTRTLLFDPCGGSPCEAKTVTYGLPLGTLPVPQRARFLFDGWYTAAEGGSELTDASIFTAAEDMTAYARWIPLVTARDIPCSVWVMTQSGPRPAGFGRTQDGHFEAGLLFYRADEGA